MFCDGWFFFSSFITNWSLLVGKNFSWREFKAGTQAETTELCCLLACSPALVILISYTFQDYLFEGGTFTEDWVLTHQSSVKEILHKVGLRTV